MTEILTQIGVENATAALSFIMIFISICAIFTSLITEALKSINKIDMLPTKLVCYIVALITTPLVFCTAMAFIKQPAEWFMIPASVLISFVVAKVSMNGWDDLTELTHRLFRK